MGLKLKLGYNARSNPKDNLTKLSSILLCCLLQTSPTVAMEQLCTSGLVAQRLDLTPGCHIAG